MKHATKAAVVTMMMISTNFAQSIRIDLARGSERERKTKSRLEQLISSHDLGKYTFTREVLIDERAMNHAFPTLTLNVRFADSSDELLSSYILGTLTSFEAHRFSWRSP